jgi:hypothetical protein
MAFLFNYCHILQLSSHPIEYFFSQFRMGDLTASKPYSDSDLGPLVQKAPRIAQLIVNVMLASFGAKANLLDLGLFLSLAGFPLLLRPLIEEFAVVQQTAHRWARLWSNLHQICVLLPGDAECFNGRYNTNLSTLLVNQANFWR